MLRVWLAIGLLLTGCVLAGPVHAESQAITQLVENARYWEIIGRGDLARAALEKRLLVEPDNASVSARRSFVRRWLGACASSFQRTI